MKKLLLTLLFILITIVANAFTTHVTLTTYNPVKSQCNSEPLITANGTKIDLKKLKQGKLKYCAISRDLLWCIPHGSIIEIEGHGVYEVVDTMNERFNHCIDILQHYTEKNFKKEKIKITVLKNGRRTNKGN